VSVEAIQLLPDTDKSRGYTSRENTNSKTWTGGMPELKRKNSEGLSAKPDLGVREAFTPRQSGGAGNPRKSFRGRTRRSTTPPLKALTSSAGRKPQLKRATSFRQRRQSSPRLDGSNSPVKNYEDKVPGTGTTMDLDGHIDRELLLQATNCGISQQNQGDQISGLQDMMAQMNAAMMEISKEVILMRKEMNSQQHAALSMATTPKPPRSQNAALVDRIDDNDANTPQSPTPRSQQEHSFIHLPENDEKKEHLEPPAMQAVQAISRGKTDPDKPPLYI